MARISEVRRQYEKEYRQMQKEINRNLEETKPGTKIRNNPDYDLIMQAIQEERKAREG